MKQFSKAIFFILITVFSSTLVFAQPSGGVKGRVRDSRDKSIAEVRVTARQNGKDLKTVLTDGKGDFVLDNLEAGNYNIVFDKNGYNSAVRYDVEIKKNKTRDLGSRLVLTVDQGTQVIIKGVVFDEAGRSVRGANIEIEKKQSDGSYRKVSSTTSSFGAESLATGEFVFRFPVAGGVDFRITAAAKGVSASKDITVGGAAVYRLALTLKVKSEQ